MRARDLAQDAPLVVVSTDAMQVARAMANAGRPWSEAVDDEGRSR